MHDILEAIVSLAIADSGAKELRPDREPVIEKLWEDASPETKKFITDLSKEDLESACIGEVNDDGQRMVGDKWVYLPEEVDRLLEDIMGEVYW